MSGKMYKTLLAAVFFTHAVHAQEILSIEDAMKIALEKNPALLVVKNQKEITRLQNNLGNAGMSPTLSINASGTSSNLDSYQVFSTGAVQDRTGAKSSGVGASLNAEWTVFDGFRMFAVRKRLSMNETLSDLELKRQMENTLMEVITAYYNIVRVTELIKAARQNLLIYEERQKISELRNEIGSDSKVGVLLSKSEANKARTAIIQQELELLYSKTNLNSILGRSVDIDFKASDTIIVNYDPGLEELKKEASKSNTSLLFSRQNELLFDQTIKEARSATLPFITVNGAYIYTRTQSQAGFLFSNQQNGLNLGLTGRWTFFNGGRNTNLIKERQVQALNQRFITEQTQLQVDALVYVNFQSYQLNKRIVEMEFQNLKDAQEVLNISLERYKVGKANLLETIETQKNLEDVQARYINALFLIKLAEANLMKANGTLVR